MEWRRGGAQGEVGVGNGLVGWRVFTEHFDLLNQHGWLSPSLSFSLENIPEPHPSGSAGCLV